MGGGPDFWHWGHVHAGAVFKEIQSQGVSVHCRCVGHGSFPEYPVELVNWRKVLAWAETRTAKDPSIQSEALHGFAI